MLGLINRTLGATLPGRLGSLLILAGLGLLVYGLGAYVGILPGGYASAPRPESFVSGDQRSARVESGPTPPEPAAERSGQAVSQPVAQPALDLAKAAGVGGLSSLPNAADVADRREAALGARPGFPIRLVLASIDVDTEVKEGGVVAGKDGELEWETLPFVATTYPILGPIGAPGNAVISGHVVTLREGNVFRNLYKVGLGEPIDVYTANSHFTYVVEEVLLVAPNAVEVLAPTRDARLTVITCAGTFDPRTRTFSDRLIVIGKLMSGERL